jgi:tripartite-type tricarboxylate transporter receptor subunit TctC
MLAVIGGQIAIGFVGALSARENIRAGRVVALALPGSRGLPSLPDVPTMAVSGVPGYELELWSAILAPAKTPPEVIARLDMEIVGVIQSADFTHFMAE